MANINFNFKGISDALSDLRNTKQTFKNDVTNILIESAENITTFAKQKAPKDMGTLSQSVNNQVNITTDIYSFEVGTPFMYGAYMEFGTGGKVDTRGYDEYASEFKGKGGGTMNEFIAALTKWVQRKGLAGTYSVKTRKRTGNKAAQVDENKKLAWVIAMSILRKGVNPHPWLLPSFETELPNFNKNINAYLNA